MLYQVDILDRNRSLIGRVINTPAINGDVWLKYSSQLSGYGTAQFRVSVRDPFVQTATGNIVTPFANHIRISRAGQVVWQGIVVDNPKRTKDFIEVIAYEYPYLLTKSLIAHDAAPLDTNYRTFNSGTMASSVTAIINEAIANAPAGSALKSFTVGTVENPVFPPGFTDSATPPLDLSGKPWGWGTNFLLKFDYRDAYYVINTFGIYSQFDFELDSNLAFNFKKQIGNLRPDINFTYSSKQPLNNTIEDFDSPLKGSQMTNHLVGIAADNDFNVIKVDQTLDTSINTYGQVDGVAAYSDVKTAALLKARLAQELQLSGDPSGSLDLYVKPSIYPVGTWKIGDTINVSIDHFAVQLKSLRKIVGSDVSVYLNGYEEVRVITNIPRPSTT